MSRIRVRTVQGIGDLFWVYQKLAPHFSVIDFDVAVLYESEVEKRASQFLGLLPQAGEIRFVTVTPAEMECLCAMKPLLPVADGDYAVNRWLEEGTSLYSIDAGADVQSFVPMLGVQGRPTIHDGALTVFVSDRKPGIQWDSNQWRLAIGQVADELDIQEIQFIGAKWDEDFTEEVCDMVAGDGWIAENFCGELTLLQSIELIVTGAAMFGHQSGLHVIAHNYGVPTLIVDYDKYAPMRYTWCNPQRHGFGALLFSQHDMTREKARLLVASVPS